MVDLSKAIPDVDTMESVSSITLNNFLEIGAWGHNV